ncbi:MAG TPA: FtsQ-type POTRA domain-containing protein [Acidimicrobiia bacterium]|nr:FtsQ-type POTRA domain-containing protein [Acidimicrobiia bacterium]
MRIDPRLAERRREVAEDRARRKVNRLVKLLIAIGVLGGVVWLFLSPLLSVATVTTSGIAASSAASVLVEQGVVSGTPLILVRAGSVESALEADPWVRESVVEVDWPTGVVVRIDERVPVGWLETDEGWGLYAVDGVQLAAAPEPDPLMPWIQLGPVPIDETESSPDVLGSLEFAATLPDELKAGARVRTEPGGEIWAEVTGFQVRLGRPVEMGAKALSLAALLRDQPPSGSTLTLIAPTHPAVSPP